MAYQVKFTAKRGQVDVKDVTVAAGSAEAQSDTISVNIDVTNLTKGDALMLVDQISAAIHAGPWPPLA